MQPPHADRRSIRHSFHPLGGTAPVCSRICYVQRTQIPDVVRNDVDVDDALPLHTRKETSIGHRHRVASIRLPKRLKRVLLRGIHRIFARIGHRARGEAR